VLQSQSNEPSASLAAGGFESTFVQNEELTRSPIDSLTLKSISLSEAANDHLFRGHSTPYRRAFIDASSSRIFQQGMLRADSPAYLPSFADQFSPLSGMNVNLSESNTKLSLLSPRQPASITPQDTVTETAGEEEVKDVPSWGRLRQRGPVLASPRYTLAYTENQV
jgi:hypothetical protein